MISEFDMQKHGGMLRRWLDAYGIEMPPEDVLAGKGIVVDDTAMGFLFRDERARRGYLDNIIANPLAMPEERDLGLRALTRVLTAHAEMMGLRFVTVLANVRNMRRRFQDLGFRHHADFGLYYKELGGL